MCDFNALAVCPLTSIIKYNLKKVSILKSQKYIKKENTWTLQWLGRIKCLVSIPWKVCWNQADEEEKDQLEWLALQPHKSQTKCQPIYPAHSVQQVRRTTAVPSQTERCPLFFYVLFLLPSVCACAHSVHIWYLRLCSPCLPLAASCGYRVEWACLGVEARAGLGKRWLSQCLD